MDLQLNYTKMLHTVVFLALFAAAVHCMFSQIFSILTYRCTYNKNYLISAHKNVFSAGVPQPQPFIVGGRETTIDRFPFMVSLQTNGYDHFCGGSILDEYTILTAAHCVGRLSPLDVNRLYIRAGSSNWFEGGEKYNVTGIHIHENFNDEIGDRDNDIALLTLGRPLMFSRNVQPILLPHKKFKPLSADTVIVAGWGTRSYDNDDFPEILNYLDVRIVDQKVCKNAYSDWEPYVVTERQLCAGWMGIGNKDACQVCRY